MSTWDDYAEDELRRVMGYETIRHPIHDRHNGGEYDALRALPREVKRTLTGAQLLTPHGLPPDVAADLIERDLDDAIEWYVAVCLAWIRQRRRNAWWQRHYELAQRNGYETFWYYRKAHLQQRREAA